MIGSNNIIINTGGSNDTSSTSTDVEFDRDTSKDDDLHKEPWFKNYWRPAAAWTYLVICIFDFVLAPVLLGVFSALTKVAFVAWTPLTLQGGGLFHLSFGAIVGTYVYGRTHEKLSGVSDDYDSDSNKKKSSSRED